MKAKELVEKCEEKLKVGWSMRKFFRLAWYSFRSEFRAIREDITFNNLAEGEIKRFIQVCDNRVNRAGIFLNEIAMVLGFVLTALSIIAVIYSGRIGEEMQPVQSLLFTGEYYSITFRMGVTVLVFCLLFLLALLAHYRTQVHAWTVFNEEAILNEKYIS